MLLMKLPTIIAIVLGSVVVAAAIIYITTPKNSNVPVPTLPPLATPTANQPEASAPSDLVSEDLTVGTGPAVVAGDTVSVHYTGTLTNGQKFDSSLDRGQPFEFSVGAGQVIKGWDQGLVGMQVGGKRKLTIPASLGYGNRSVGTIPANSTLIFEIELLAIK